MGGMQCSPFPRPLLRLRWCLFPVHAQGPVPAVWSCDGMHTCVPTPCPGQTALWGVRRPCSIHAQNICSNEVHVSHLEWSSYGPTLGRLQPFLNAFPDIFDTSEYPKVYLRPGSERFIQDPNLSRRFSRCIALSFQRLYGSAFVCVLGLCSCVLICVRVSIVCSSLRPLLYTHKHEHKQFVPAVQLQTQGGRHGQPQPASQRRHGCENSCDRVGAFCLSRDRGSVPGR